MSYKEITYDYTNCKIKCFLVKWWRELKRKSNKLLIIMKKHKKSSVIISIVAIITVIRLISPSQEEKLKQYAKERLQNHYGEDFDIFSVSGSYESFTVVAAPARDHEILFKAGYKYGGSKYDNDEYIEACTAHMLKDEIYPSISQIYGNVIVCPYLFCDAPPVFKADKVSMDYLKRYVKNPEVYFVIIIDKSLCNNVDDEYDKLSDIFVSFEEDDGIHSTANIYFLGADEFQYFREYSSTHLKVLSKLDDLALEGECIDAGGFAVKEGKLTITKDEYYEKRGDLR